MKSYTQLTDFNKMLNTIPVNVMSPLATCYMLMTTLDSIVYLLCLRGTTRACRQNGNNPYAIGANALNKSSTNIGRRDKDGQECSVER
jgi:hypothetical protein